MIAELAAIINMCGHISCKHDKFCVKIQTENVYVARKYFTLVKKAFNIDSEVLLRRNSQLKKNRVYIIYVNGETEALRLLMACGIVKGKAGCFTVKNCIDPIVVKSVCCRRAYIRGAFLASGSVTDPERNYHIEFVSLDYSYSVQLAELINSFEAEAKIVKRKEHYVVYIKEGEQIVELLNIMGAHIALMELENVRILKDMRNNVNRIVNCETANLNKTVEASVKQIEDIKYVEKNGGLCALPDALQETARLRLEYPDASLKELGLMMNPTVGKSGVNHRLRKLSNIAKTIREDKGDFL